MRGPWRILLLILIRILIFLLIFLFLFSTAAESRAVI